MARWMLIVLSAGLALAGGAAFADSEEAIQVGMARIDITPPIDMKATLGGYGERMSRPASGVHDRLFAKALVVNSADKKFALVTLDALGLPPAVKPAVLEKLAGDGWKEEEILLLPSHSHTSIEMNAINPKNVFPIPNLGIYQPALFDLVVGKLVEVIRAAGSQRVDARIGTGSVLLDGEWKRNRRDGNSFIDPTLTVTRIDTLDGKPLAVGEDLGGFEELLRGLLLAFGADHFRAPLALGLGLARDHPDHALVEVDVLDLDVRHLDSPRVGLRVENVLDVVVELVALGEHLVEVVLAEHRAQGRLGEFARRLLEVLHLDHRLVGLHHPEINDRVDLHRDVVARNHVLRRNVEHQRALVHAHHLLHVGQQQDQPRPLHAGEAPEREHDAAFVLAKDAHRRREDPDDNEENGQVDG